MINAPSQGESVVDVIRIMMPSLSGASTDSQIRLPGTVFVLDMGYQSKEVNRQITECNASIIGTHEWNRNFPFTYGKPGVNLQKVVIEMGDKTTVHICKERSQLIYRLPLNFDARIGVSVWPG
ncbi:hypothetical protein PHMEG_00014996 [Phytophthora megakarya]|uniref:Transposase n=1 Tax=Phytophthora megakarya TaxID=4795 RepID=A0A225W2J2_9STRA|nr:hypothetical protein PHMEG_00014996 [Phytophthora megakarya]